MFFETLGAMQLRVSERARGVKLRELGGRAGSCVDMVRPASRLASCWASVATERAHESRSMRRHGTAGADIRWYRLLEQYKESPAMERVVP